MAETILVTGATGFTGRWFMAEAAAHGFCCIGVSKSAQVMPHAVGQSISCDLTDSQAVYAMLAQVKPDYIVHLAAIAFVPHACSRDIYLTNVVATTNLLDAAIKHCPNIKKVLISSSANVYGNAKNLPITESAILAPANDYAVSKIAMESAAALRMPLLPIIIVRPFNYTGVGQAEHFILPKVISAFKQQKTELELGNIDVARDFSDVRDVARAYLKLLNTNIAAETFNLCSGQLISLRQIINEVALLSGHRLTIKISSSLVRANEVKEYYGCEKKLIDAIGSYRQITSFSDTLFWMLSTK